jgi:hypothetical protein
MKFNFIKKIEEADEVQNGNGDPNTSQEVNTNSDNQQNKDNDSETTDLTQKLDGLMSMKAQYKAKYDAELKTINAQIILNQQQRANIQSTNIENDEQAQAVKGKLIKINSDINGLLKRKLEAKKAYQQNIKNVEDQILLNNAGLAENGGDVDPKSIDENYKRSLRFSRKLYEAVLNRTDEMYAMIKMSFGDIENLSFQPSSTNCRTFAKNIIAFLNKLGWGSGENEDKLRNFLYDLLDASHISLGRNEKDKFVENLTSAMNDNQLFKWIFTKER